MNSNRIYSILKAVLADLTNKKKSEIFANDSLRTNLRFNNQGLFSLAVDLNRAFKEEGLQIKPKLHGDETTAAQTVRDLRILISGRF